LIERQRKDLTRSSASAQSDQASKPCISFRVNSASKPKRAR
jgi:hypothetical protein